MNESDEYSFYENFSEELKYLETIRGPKYLPLTLVVPVTLAYVVIFVTGFAGNIITCIVIWRNPTAQTATNYYLFNLAVSDLLFLVLGLPFELSVFWQQYPWQWGLGICKLRAYVSETSSYVSVLTIVAFSVERYLAICHPLRHYGSGLKRSIRSIFGAWLVALIFAMPFAAYIDIDYVKYPQNSTRNSEESAICAMLNMPEFPLYQLSCILFFLVPMVFIVVLYVRIGLRIQSDTLAQNVEGYVHGETKQAQSRKTITRMLSAVVITFFICWAPFHIQRLLYVYEDSMHEDMSQWFYPLTGCLYYFSTTINPILYNVMGAKYRNAFKETCRCSSSSPSISRVGQSSVRDSSTICGGRPSKGSQIFRGRGANCQRRTYSASGCMENNLRGAGQLQPDDGEGEKRAVAANDSSTGDKSSEEIVDTQCSQRPRKTSILIHAKNGRLRYHVSDKDDIPSDETHI
ncbi:Neuropeptides capa receptor [Eufriesea mexicana]|uniref:neuropeptides capa receptor-like n=1 Tax=Eufriesea mexicana TaxID=516756 RepID=UPI00083C0E0B|nr:PREDICTED: neuropeptides capa receptor-like [Eufriesea mexicana]OAD61211.1 Neuropeptides capa receptor [Eufriesea mexicana]